MSSASSHRAPSGPSGNGAIVQAKPNTPSAKSHRTFQSEDYRVPSEFGFTTEENADMDVDMSMTTEELGGEAVHFCLLAEFDIDAGATLTDQYPHPTGTDEQ
jgi:hypothetical protein